MIQLFPTIRHRNNQTADFINWCTKPHSARWIKYSDMPGDMTNFYACMWCNFHIDARLFNRHVADNHIMDDGYVLGLSRGVIERLLEF